MNEDFSFLILSFQVFFSNRMYKSKEKQAALLYLKEPLESTKEIVEQKHIPLSVKFKFIIKRNKVIYKHKGKS